MIKHILIVEDNATALYSEKTLMEKLGCIVTSAKTGEEAVELFKNNHYELILMDLGLPGISGIEATRQMRTYEQNEQRTPTPIIAVTGSIDHDQHQRCIEAGMKEVCTKPFTIETAHHLVPFINFASQLLMSYI